MSDCPHPVRYQGLCAACGQDVSALPIARPAAAAASSGASSGSGLKRRSPASAGSSAGASAAVAAAAASAASAEEDGGSHAIVLGGQHKTIHLSSAALSERTRLNTIELLEARKLLCVLDLDHTLLHATSDPRVSAWVGKEPDLHSFLLGHGPSLRTHYVKLRPGLQRFLEATAKLFDLHVYTMGARAYADAVVPICDPTHRFIKHRVVSRDEGGDTPGSGGASTGTSFAPPFGHQKSLKRMYPCDEGMIGIVDDRVDVWAANAKNVVRAFEFMYFSGRGEMNSRPDGQKQPEADLPIASHQLSTHPHPDNVLTSLTAVLDAVHQLFYGQVDRALTIPSSSPDAPPKKHPVSDVFPLSPEMSIPRLIHLAKLTTLEGCVIVFSGVFPTLTKDGQPLNRGLGAQKAEAWVHATAFGAVCLEDFPGVNTTTGEELKEDDDQILPFGVDSVALSRDPPLRVTHVVAARDGSPKLRYAAKMPDDVRPFVVHVSWLWHSIAHFQRGEEHLFPLWSDANRKEAGNSPEASPIAETTSETPPSGTNVSDVGNEVDVVMEPVVIEPVHAPTVISESASTDASVASLSLTHDYTATAAAPSLPLSLSTPSAPASSFSSSSAAAPPTEKSTTIVGGIKRRVTKKVQPVEMNSGAAAATAVSNASSAASNPQESKSSDAPRPTPSPSPLTANLSAAEKYRYSLHLVHHCQSPPTPSALVQRITQHLAAKEESARAREELAELTKQREVVKAQTLQARRRSAGTFQTPTDLSPAAAAASPPSAALPRCRKKSVSFSSAELGPTNPRYEEEAHTMSDVDGPATGGSGGRVEPSASLKRKAHIPLDDVDRLHKERKITHPAARSKSGASAAASVSPSARRSLESIQADADASMQDHSASSFPDGVTTEELYRDRDADETAQRVDEGAGGEEVDPFDLGDAFDDIGGYEDDNFQDDE